jgi:hypothetical protein
MVHTYLKKRNNSDMLEVVIPEAVRAAASRYGMTHTALYYEI